MVMNCSVHKMVCSKRLCRVLYDIICIVRLGVVCLPCGNFLFVVKIDEDQWMYDNSTIYNNIHMINRYF